MKIWMLAFCLCLHKGNMFVHIWFHLHDVIIPWDLTNRANFMVQSFLLDCNGRFSVGTYTL